MQAKYNFPLNVSTLTLVISKGLPLVNCPEEVCLR